MNIGSIGVASIGPTTATPAENPALEKPRDVPGETLPLTEARDEEKAPPPPGLGRIVDKTA